MLQNTELEIFDVIHESSYKVPKASVAYGKYKGSEVIVKTGGEELARELDILRNIDDTRIPAVIDFGSNADGTNRLVLNKLPGTPLDQYIHLQPDWHSDRLGRQEAIRIVMGLSACFSVLKKAGFLYRDLNFGHILVDDEMISLVDHEWDISLSATGSGTVDSLAGTWETMAPEEYTVGNSINEASNIYTLGSVLLQLISGKSPFYISKDDEPDAEKRRDATLHLMEIFPGVNTGDAKLDEIVNTSLQWDPADRYKSIEDFRNAVSS